MGGRGSEEDGIVTAITIVNIVTIVTTMLSFNSRVRFVQV